MSISTALRLRNWEMDIEGHCLECATRQLSEMNEKMSKLLGQENGGDYVG